MVNYRKQKHLKNCKECTMENVKRLDATPKKEAWREVQV